MARGHATDSSAIDLSLISAFFELSQQDVENLIASPTQDLVKAFLQSATIKAQGIDELKAEKLHLDVEFQNLARASETKIKAHKSTIAKQSTEIEELRTELGKTATERDSLQSQLNNLRKSTTDSSDESQTLHNRIRSLESSNRDTLAVVEKLSTDKDRLNKDIQEQHAKAIALRREVSNLQEQNQTLQNAASAQRFKEQNLRQELELIKKTNEWQITELRTTSQEHAKFRKERNARTNELERNLETASAEIGALQRNGNTLKIQLEDLQQRLDESYTRNATAQEVSAKAQQTLEGQVETSKKLAELHAITATTHKSRLQDLQAQFEQMKDDAAEEIGRLQTEIETERADREQAEQRVAALELQVERGSRPATPIRNGAHTPDIGSPAFGSVQKIGRNLSHTQMYSQCVEAKKELEEEQRRSETLRTAVDGLIEEMESRAPQLMEAQQERDMLKAEVLQFSTLLDNANELRNAAVLEAERWQNEAQGAAQESDILRQQLRDLSAQIKILLVEMQSREQGLGEMSAHERMELERVARGDELEGLSNTQQLISERLVIFRGVADLQKQNEQLLRLTRELGEKMEGEEAQARDRQAATDAAQVEQLQHQLQRYKDEMQATAIQVDSYMKERDMFRRMLQHRGTLPANADTQAMFGSSMALIENGEPATPRSRDAQDLNKLLKEQQTFFDQYRTEASTDRRNLKDQVDSLTREKSELQTQVARAQAQTTLSGERFDMLQSNLKSIRAENEELQKRYQLLTENNAKQDVRTQQVAEELIETRSLADSLRAENGNMKAEKDLWKRIEDRLTDENKILMDERSRLSKLTADLQNLANERELSDSEARRRLQSQAESLENELADTKKKLEAESDNSRKLSMRKEFDEAQNRTRIDDLVKSLGNVREELVAAKTIKDQLQSRVDEMKIELRAAEEKTAALQSHASRNQSIDQNLAPEQQLAIQVSDLRRDLDHGRIELDSAKSQIEQYKTIAQNTEDELASLNQTTEQYRTETDKAIAEKDETINTLEQRMEDLVDELKETNTELSELRIKHDDASRVLDSQRATLEAEIARLKDESERYTDEKRLYKEDIIAQAEIAAQAQQSYENELVKHAEAAQSLNTIRKELNELRSALTSARSEAESAKASLEQGSDSWAEQKERLEREMEELKRRKVDADAQNKLLYRQMESISTELQALRQGRTLPAADGEATASTDSNLQEVITYLRREKEIIEVQHELSSQESTRLQQQLDYANGQLDDLHAKLAEERKNNSERITSEATNNRLLERMNELNLLRESNVTLRNDASQSKEKVAVREHEIARLSAELEPLKTRVTEAENELEMKNGELKLLTDDRDHWRDRTQNIISKYDRVDPGEIEALRKQIETLQSEKDDIEQRRATVQDDFDAAEKHLEEALAEQKRTTDESLSRFKDQAKTRDRQQKEKIAQIQTSLDSAKAEQERLQAALDASTAELEAAKSAAQSTNAARASETSDHEELHRRISAAETSAAEHLKNVEQLQTRIAELELERSSLTARITELEDAADVEQGEIDENDNAANELENYRQQLEAATEEIAKLKEAGDAALPPDVQEMKAEMENQHQLAIAQIQQAADAKVQAAEAALQTRLDEERGKLQEEVRQELIAAHSTELQTARDECEASINSLKSAHAAEIERLQQDAQKLASNTVAAQANINETLTDEQVDELMKSNMRLRARVQTSLKKQTEKWTAAVAEKDNEIKLLKEIKAEVAPADSGLESKLAEAEKERDALSKELEKAQEAKNAAVAQALDTAEKKTRLQLNQRDMALARVAVVQKAATDTPQRAVGEVWEEAKKAKPNPKPAASTAVAPSSVSSPTTATLPSAAPTEATTSSDAKPQENSSDPPSQEDKLKARAARFGTKSDAAQPNPEAAAFVPADKPGSSGSSGIPRARGGANSGISIRGQAGSARGAFASFRGRGGAGQGVKRQHEGGQGGDGKRPRGGLGP